MNPQLLNAEDLGVKLEIAGGLAIWEAAPVWKHQKAVDRIRDSIRKAETEENASCECIDAADIYVSFSDGSLKRPDISIFCSEPPEDEQGEAIRQVPEAVIEVISKKYEAKDLENSADLSGERREGCRRFQPLYERSFAFPLRRGKARNDFARRD